ncbi:DegT/DnrJ/EryC1/StrS family aminotransferase [Shewanella baltica]|uniref:DegT/DnrJ/EryC1/StrS family aminotransferase n=1 Tax=Shewanella baltica TaxID=62322 RepID=UPI00217DEFB3|nr:DegT/DnrJ/EryC1/StrS family aminotransferase [Shewanella baltica]MCS6237831.1 DegT/DnrJ/EryC1/StrS family aminotransferase [Shewanella baltica]MCS6272457.1 DegT/DnrJ/EryC1/StrS family aminotransferase [Shewanella baltica]
MQFIDLKSQYASLKDKIDKNIHNVLDHGQYVMGPEVYELEKKLAEYTNAKHCISCSSGSDALIMALMAHGIGEGDVVVTTPFTFIATAEAIKLVGAKPLFVDIDIDTFNLSPRLLEEMLEAIASNQATIHSNICNDIKDIKAIMTVDLFGLPADAAAINKIANKYGLIVIEDSAQAFGGSVDGAMASNLADIGCTSFFPAKPLGCYGDGGAIFTNNDEIAAILTSIRVHGQGLHKYENIRIGLTGRLDTIQAAVLLPKLEVLDTEIKLRQNVAELYTSKLSKIAGITTPSTPDGYTSAWAQYTLMAKDDEHRTQITEHLKNNDVPTAIYYPIPLHEQKVFNSLGYAPNAFEVSSNVAKRVFSLPMHPYLQAEDIDKICKLIETM